jgi:hypothetical protein
MLLTSTFGIHFLTVKLNEISHSQQKPTRTPNHSQMQKIRPSIKMKEILSAVDSDTSAFFQNLYNATSDPAALAS